MSRHQPRIDERYFTIDRFVIWIISLILVNGALVPTAADADEERLQVTAPAEWMAIPDSKDSVFVLKGSKSRQAATFSRFQIDRAYSTFEFLASKRALLEHERAKLFAIFGLQDYRIVDVKTDVDENGRRYQLLISRYLAADGTETLMYERQYAVGDTVYRLSYTEGTDSFKDLKRAEKYLRQFNAVVPKSKDRDPASDSETTAGVRTEVLRGNEKPQGIWENYIVKFRSHPPNPQFCEDVPAALRYTGDDDGVINPGIDGLMECGKKFGNGMVSFITGVAHYTVSAFANQIGSTFGKYDPNNYAHKINQQVAAPVFNFVSEWWNDKSGHFLANAFANASDAIGEMMPKFNCMNLATRIEIYCSTTIDAMLAYKLASKIALTATESLNLKRLVQAAIDNRATQAAKKVGTSVAEAARNKAQPWVDTVKEKAAPAIEKAKGAAQNADKWLAETKENADFKRFKRAAESPTKDPLASATQANEAAGDAAGSNTTSAGLTGSNKSTQGKFAKKMEPTADQLKAEAETRANWEKAAAARNTNLRLGLEGITNAPTAEQAMRRLSELSDVAGEGGVSGTTLKTGLNNLLTTGTKKEIAEVQQWVRQYAHREIDESVLLDRLEKMKAFSRKTPPDAWNRFNALNEAKNANAPNAPETAVETSKPAEKARGAVAEKLSNAAGSTRERLAEMSDNVKTRLTRAEPRILQEQKLAQHLNGSNEYDLAKSGLQKVKAIGSDQVVERLNGLFETNPELAKAQMKQFLEGRLPATALGIEPPAMESAAKPALRERDRRAQIFAEMESKIETPAGPSTSGGKLKNAASKLKSRLTPKKPLEPGSDGPALSRTRSLDPNILKGVSPEYTAKLEQSLAKIAPAKRDLVVETLNDLHLKDPSRASRLAAELADNGLTRDIERKLSGLEADAPNKPVFEARRQTTANGSFGEETFQNGQAFPKAEVRAVEINRSLDGSVPASANFDVARTQELSLNANGASLKPATVNGGSPTYKPDVPVTARKLSPTETRGTVFNAAQRAQVNASESAAARGSPQRSQLLNLKKDFRAIQNTEQALKELDLGMKRATKEFQMPEAKAAWDDILSSSTKRTKSLMVTLAQRDPDRLLFLVDEYAKTKGLQKALRGSRFASALEDSVRATTADASTIAKSNSIRNIRNALGGGPKEPTGIRRPVEIPPQPKGRFEKIKDKAANIGDKVLTYTGTKHTVRALRTGPGAAAGIVSNHMGDEEDDLSLPGNGGPESPIGLDGGAEPGALTPDQIIAPQVDAARASNGGIAPAVGNNPGGASLGNPLGNPIGAPTEGQAPSSPSDPLRQDLPNANPESQPSAGNPGLGPAGLAIAATGLAAAAPGAISGRSPGRSDPQTQQPSPQASTSGSLFPESGAQDRSPPPPVRNAQARSQPRANRSSRPSSPPSSSDSRAKNDPASDEQIARTSKKQKPKAPSADEIRRAHASEAKIFESASKKIKTSKGLETQLQRLASVPGGKHRSIAKTYRQLTRQKNGGQLAERLASRARNGEFREVVRFLESHKNLKPSRLSKSHIDDLVANYDSHEDGGRRPAAKKAGHKRTKHKTKARGAQQPDDSSESEDLVDDED